MVKIKLNLKNQEILLVEAFLFHNLQTSIFPDILLSQNDGSEQYFKKPFPEEYNDKCFKETNKFY